MCSPDTYALPLGLGGTILKRAMSGHKIFVIFLATGIAARYQNPDKEIENIKHAIKNLREEAEKSAAIENTWKEISQPGPPKKFFGMSTRNFDEEDHLSTAGGRGNVRTDTFFTMSNVAALGGNFLGLSK